MPATFFIVSFISSFICMVIVLKRIHNFEKAHIIEKSRRSFLVCMAVLCPFVGILVTRNLR